VLADSACGQVSFIRNGLNYDVIETCLEANGSDRKIAVDPTPLTGMPGPGHPSFISHRQWCNLFPWHAIALGDINLKKGSNYL
jgi:hypothetical protein